ncbi:hypothetical protein HED51_23810 [Ochrobactrum grignonense]|nr:hypothetical protein [Brucella grignonensis]
MATTTKAKTSARFIDGYQRGHAAELGEKKRRKMNETQLPHAASRVKCEASPGFAGT